MSPSLKSQLQKIKKNLDFPSKKKHKCVSCGRLTGRKNKKRPIHFICQKKESLNKTKQGA